MVVGEEEEEEEGEPLDKTPFIEGAGLRIGGLSVHMDILL